MEFECQRVADAAGGASRWCFSSSRDVEMRVKGKVYPVMRMDFRGEDMAERRR